MIAEIKRRNGKVITSIAYTNEIKKGDLITITLNKNDTVGKTTFRVIDIEHQVVTNINISHYESLSIIVDDLLEYL